MLQKCHSNVAYPVYKVLGALSLVIGTKLELRPHVSRPESFCGPSVVGPIPSTKIKIENKNLL